MHPTTKAVGVGGQVMFAASLPESPGDILTAASTNAAIVSHVRNARELCPGAHGAPFCSFHR